MILEFQCIPGKKHPITGDVWHRFPRCLIEGGDRYDRYLCSALFMTMQTPAACVQAIELLDLVQGGQSKEESFGINDTCVIFSVRGAQVEILIEEDSKPSEGLFTLSEFRQASCAWEEFLRKSEAREYAIKVDIS